MNTPAHILIGWAAFGRNGSAKLSAAAIAGALAPDLSLYLLGSVSLFLLNIPPAIVFGELYFSALWQGIFAVDNSFFVWGAGLAIAYWRKSAVAQVLCCAALLHLALDFPLHHDDGRPHFWPVSQWVFESPVSYWDRGHHAGVVGPIEVCVSAIATLLIVTAKPITWTMVFPVALLGFELFISWRWFTLLFT